MGEPAVLHRPYHMRLVRSLLSNVRREMALGQRCGSPDTPLVLAVSELQQRTERASSASEVTRSLTVIKALHGNVASLGSCDQGACARPVTEGGRETPPFPFQLAREIKVTLSRSGCRRDSRSRTANWPPATPTSCCSYWKTTWRVVVVRLPDRWPNMSCHSRVSARRCSTARAPYAGRHAPSWFLVAPAQENCLRYWRSTGALRSGAVWL